MTPDNPTDVIQDEELSARFTDFVARLRSVFTNKDLSASGSAAAVAMLVATRLDVIEGTRAALEAAQPLNGDGWVFFNEDTGEEYARNHPIESGEVPDATAIRRSTAQEDTLHAAYQHEWQRANAALQAAQHRQEDVEMREEEVGWATVNAFDAAAAQCQAIAKESTFAASVSAEYREGIKAAADFCHAILRERARHASGEIPLARAALERNQTDGGE